MSNCSINEIDSSSFTNNIHPIVIVLQLFGNTYKKSCVGRASLYARMMYIESDSNFVVFPCLIMRGFILVNYLSMPNNFKTFVSCDEFPLPHGIV